MHIVNFSWHCTALYTSRPSPTAFHRPTASKSYDGFCLADKIRLRPESYGSVYKFPCVPLPSVPVPDELGSPRDSEETGASGADSLAHDMAVWSGSGCFAKPLKGSCNDKEAV